ncbi:MAG TPA: asparagine synthase (glutamine-hydrolyzing), partial [Vicinamibacteria bacterium]|nr:asparagine synthase (glutamine-hydrolyzing) [Vicinamibacteria bacterium]
MCGICGVVRWDGVTQTHVQRALAMRGLLEHRGPDDKGAEADERAALAATRLSIRGSEAGHQPLRNPATGVMASCNGEIDNHRDLRRWLEARGHEVATGSDMAILPYLYEEHGERFVEELEGPFALALWDPRSGLLLLARDRAGERPLFYIERDDEVVFATELSALALDSGKGCCLDERALRHYLRFGRFPAPLSPVPAIRKVAPAEIVCFREKSVERRQYWRWSMGTLPKREPSLEAFDRVFREAVARQTDCDVPFGMFLSGGVDSSLVAAVAREIHPERRLPAYTLRFGEASYDEGPAAASVAERLGLTNETVWVRAEDFPPKIRELVRLTGEPLGDPAWVPTALLAQRAAKDVKVVLVGEGGDEVFGGYPTYVGARLAKVYERLPSPIRRAFSRLVRRWPPSDRKVALSFLLKRFVEGSGIEPLARHLLWTSVIPPAVLERLGCQPSGLDSDLDRA